MTYPAEYLSRYDEELLDIAQEATYPPPQKYVNFGPLQLIYCVVPPPPQLSSGFYWLMARPSGVRKQLPAGVWVCIHCVFFCRRCFPQIVLSSFPLMQVLTHLPKGYVPKKKFSCFLRNSTLWKLLKRNLLKFP